MAICIQNLFQSHKQTIRPCRITQEPTTARNSSMKWTVIRPSAFSTGARR